MKTIRKIISSPFTFTGCTLLLFGSLMLFVAKITKGGSVSTEKKEKVLNRFTELLNKI